MAGLADKLNGTPWEDQEGVILLNTDPANGTYALNAEMPIGLYTIVANYNAQIMDSVAEGVDKTFSGVTTISPNAGDSLVIGEGTFATTTDIKGTVTIEGQTEIDGTLEVTGALTLDTGLSADQVDFMLVGDTEVMLDGTTAAEQQELIDAQPKNLNGHTLTFIFDEDITTDSVISFDHFTGGKVLVQGDVTDDYDVIPTTRAVTLAGLGLSTEGCQDITFRSLGINVTTADAPGIHSSSSGSVVVEGCLIETDSTGVAVLSDRCSHLDLRFSKLITSEIGVHKISGSALIHQCTGAALTYAMKASEGATLGYSGDELVSTGAQFTEETGGVILQQLAASQAEVNETSSLNAHKYVTPATLHGLMADQTEVNAGTDTRKYVTPETLEGRMSYMHVRCEKEKDTSGGGSSSEGWYTRELNTMRINSIIGASPAAGATVSDSFTLPAGAYRVLGYFNGRTFNTETVVQLTTSDWNDDPAAGSVILIGSTGSSLSTATTGEAYTPFLLTTTGGFVLGAVTTLKIVQWLSAGSSASNSFGCPNGETTNVYADLIIEKIG